MNSAVMSSLSWPGARFRALIVLSWFQCCLPAVCETPWRDPGSGQHQRGRRVRSHLAQRWGSEPNKDNQPGQRCWITTETLLCNGRRDAGEQAELLWRLPVCSRVSDPGKLHRRQSHRHQRSLEWRPARGWVGNNSACFGMCCSAATLVLLFHIWNEILPVWAECSSFIHRIIKASLQLVTSIIWSAHNAFPALDDLISIIDHVVFIKH